MTQWIKVNPLIPWKPKKPGEELVGVYTGCTRREGKYGDYLNYYVATDDCRYRVTGTMLRDLFDGTPRGSCIKLVFTGHKDTGKPHKMKLFDLYIRVPKEATDKDDQQHDYQPISA